MLNQVYEKMLRKPAIWSGPCRICGKEIREGDLIRQPFAPSSSGHNRYIHSWVCYSCSRKLHGSPSPELNRNSERI